MAYYFNFNGKIFAENTAVISPQYRGLCYGDGLFETIKLKNGQIIFEDDHFARLWKGMQLLQFSIPHHFTANKLKEEILSLAKKNNHLQTAKIRLTIFRGPGNLYNAENHKPHYSISTWPLPTDNGLLNHIGLDVTLYKQVKKCCDILSSSKTNNYLPYVMAALYAQNKKCNDAILLNNFERICDSTIANVFLVKDEIIYTPALTEGCIAGVFRKYLISKLRNQGFTCIENEITLSQLLNAQEVFLTNSIFNLRWIKNIDNKAYTNIITQKIYKLIDTFIL